MLDEDRDPKCANAHKTGYYPGGIYRYTKQFETPESGTGQEVFVEFEGVYQRSRVFLNGVEIGGRPSGYAQFRIPLTGLRSRGINLLEVVADNSKEPNSRWYTGSGIYRPVHILVGPPVHIDPTSPTVTMIELDTRRAVIEVATTLVNNTEAEVEVTLSVRVTPAEAKDLPEEERPCSATIEIDATVPAAQRGTLVHCLEIHDPQAWSVDAFAC